MYLCIAARRELEHQFHLPFPDSGHVHMCPFMHTHAVLVCVHTRTLCVCAVQPTASLSTGVTCRLLTQHRSHHHERIRILCSADMSTHTLLGLCAHYTHIMRVCAHCSSPQVRAPVPPAISRHDSGHAHTHCH